VVIENRLGASSTLAAQAVVNSPPDGYTLLLLGGSALMATLITSVPFDLQQDLAPVSGLVAYPMVLVAHPSVPATTVAELIAHAKANPGKVTVASFGTGSASHLAGELFNMIAGINLVHVPYRGDVTAEIKEGFSAAKGVSVPIVSRSASSDSKMLADQASAGISRGGYAGVRRDTGRRRTK